MVDIRPRAGTTDMKHADRLIEQGMLSVFQIRLVKMWERSKGTQHLPEFQAYDFDSIRDLLENIMVCDVDGSKQPAEFIVRSQGKVVTELYGADLSGRMVDDITPISQRPSAREDYTAAARRMVPMFRRQAMTDCSGRPVSFERLLLPFTVSRQGTDRIISAVYLFAEGNGFNRRMLLTER
jgi:hypothetical protein